jgi:hypothetical protein
VAASSTNASAAAHVARPEATIKGPNSAEELSSSKQQQPHSVVPLEASTGAEARGVKEAARQEKLAREQAKPLVVRQLRSWLEQGLEQVRKAGGRQSDSFLTGILTSTLQQINQEHEPGWEGVGRAGCLV